MALIKKRKDIIKSWIKYIILFKLLNKSMVTSEYKEVFTRRGGCVYKGVLMLNKEVLKYHSGGRCRTRWVCLSKKEGLYDKY